MMPNVDATLVVAVIAATGWLTTLVFAILKGREMVARAALEAVGSIEGRAVILAITNEKHSRIEEKLDSIQEKLDALASNVMGMTVRLAVIEDQRTSRG